VSPPPASEAAIQAVLLMRQGKIDRATYEQLMSADAFYQRETKSNTPVIKTRKGRRPILKEGKNDGLKEGKNATRVGSPPQRHYPLLYKHQAEHQYKHQTEAASGRPPKLDTGRLGMLRGSSLSSLLSPQRLFNGGLFNGCSPYSSPTASSAPSNGPTASTVGRSNQQGGSIDTTDVISPTSGARMVESWELEQAETHNRHMKEELGRAQTAYKALAQQLEEAKARENKAT
jgi:hypothetical protein